LVSSQVSYSQLPIKIVVCFDSLKSGIPFTNKRVRECNKGIPVCHKNLKKFSLSLVGAQGAFVQNICGAAGVSSILPANRPIPRLPCATPVHAGKISTK
jgi:hypothetical protein